MPTRREFLAAVPLAVAAGSLKGQPAVSPLMLTFSEPAAEWADALPIGNGRLGAMVFGGIAKERLQLNADTLWSGAPRDWNNPLAPRYLPVVRRQVLEEANYVAADETCKKMQGLFNESYQPMADCNIAFDHASSPTGYLRSLDLDTAISEVSYEVAGVLIKREAFVSAPDQLIAVRISVSTPGALSCSVSLTSPHHPDIRSTGPAEITLSGKVPSHVEPNYVKSDNPVTYSDEEGKGMRFATTLLTRTEGGDVQIVDGGIKVTGANACVILIAGATAFKTFRDAPDLPLDAITPKVHAQLDAVMHKSWERIKADHIRDYQSLFHRASLTLGTPVDAGTTTQRLAATTDHADPALLALYFQFGRYLMISSSREGTQPANLQGIWNDKVRPPWSSNWTANINLQMNYWPAETCNLTDCHQPLFDLIEGVRHNGMITARTNYHADGWCSHHNIDIWRQTGPVGLGWGSPTWANWSMSGPWLCAHLWDHYLFTGDRAFLKARAYPLMRGSADYLLSWLIDDGHGGLTTCPSLSTENNFLTPDGKTAETSAGCTMDIALTRELFRNTIAASHVLKIDGEFRTELEKAQKRLPAYKIGRFGQLQEWSIDFDEATPGQRHMSHLYGLYPGSDITPRRTPEIAKAARTSLERRLANGGAYTGWSRAWAVGFWARLGDGNKAEESLTKLMQHSTQKNLLNTHPAGQGSIFQIDGNFGATAAIAEMLLQSHDGEIALLPALPDNWSAGEFKGLRARGGVEVDARWRDRKAETATLRASHDGTFKLRAPKGQSFKHGDVLEVTLRAGSSHEIQFASA
jgi:alpha-L-fucosidase 2